jgi:GDP-4-dehydro-6-deoxy-D-mannose reductase
VKRALITGANGALGRVLAARLAAVAGWSVVATSRHAGVPGFEQLDVECGESVARTIARTRPDVVFHVAASFSPDFDTAYACNVGGTRNMLAALAATTGGPRLVLLGSAAEYGLVRPDENPIRECQPLRPMTVYGLTKAWQTQLGLMQAAQGADVVVARLFNLLADGMSDRLFVGRVQRQIAAVQADPRAAIEVGSLEAIRDYVPVAEAVDQILAIAACGTSGNVFHVGSGRALRMRDLLSTMLAQQGLDMAIVKEASPLANHRGYDVPVAYADMTATRALVEQWRSHVEN